MLHCDEAARRRLAGGEKAAESKVIKSPAAKLKKRSTNAGILASAHRSHQLMHACSNQWYPTVKRSWCHQTAGSEPAVAPPFQLLCILIFA
mmetsp:Transcript_23661/g.39051  ORF Transcript_23661/g.39051 Transcript_23661/m.39051 type:complete len:91 (+) Transcript_23661:576-848(+)